ncbi:MAG: hypothetical protein P8X91_07480 [Candidatus Bathyarchaeota archaeon]|jgi:hypothetical protein
MKNKRVAGLVLMLIVIFLLSMVVYAKKIRQRPISISFASRPARRMTNAETYVLELSWRNNDQVNSYECYFIFTLNIHKNFQIESEDLKFSFESVVIHPKVGADSLLYILPIQTLNAAETGTIIVDVTYNRPGKFHWNLGTALSN